MDPKYTNDFGQVQLVRNDIELLKSKIHLLEKEIKQIQNNCEHEFRENQLMRKCLKCDFAESTYY